MNYHVLFLVALGHFIIDIHQGGLPVIIGLAPGLSLGFAVGTGGIGATLLGYVADGWGLEQALALNAALPIVAVLFALFLPKHRSVSADTEVAT